MNLDKRPIREVAVPRKQAFEEKKESLDIVKGVLEARFGKEKLPKNLVLDILNIRKDIRHEIEKENYVEELDKFIDDRIRRLVADIYGSRFKEQEIKEVLEDNEGNLEIHFENGTIERLGDAEQELLFSLRAYFDTYRIAHNANRFRENVKETKEGIIKENEARKTNFYSEEEKKGELVSRLEEKYGKEGFSESEIKQLIEFCELKDLDELPIYEVKVMSKIKDIFSRFMGGDKTKYVGLSAALLVPAFIQGYAPMLLSDAFKGGKVDINHIFLFSALAVGSSSASFGIRKLYLNFLNSNFQKDEGIMEYVAENLTEMPSDEVKKFNLDTVKQRSKKGMTAYDSALNTMSFDILPSAVTIGTSLVLLFEKSPILAASTGVASGIVIALNRYIEKIGKFWQRQRGSEKTSEEMIKKINEQLNAHMEVVLAGEKEKFLAEIKELMGKEKIAQKNIGYFTELEEYWGNVTGVINLTLGGIAGALAGGSADKVLAAFLYSGNIDQQVQKILSSKRKLMRSLRDIMQMELMFNGYASEEEEKEKGRISVDEIKSGDINIEGVSVELDDKKILDNVNMKIPSGSMAYLEGASGAGKTTLMKVMSGYYRPSKGSVELGGINIENIKKNGEESIYGRIAYLSQFPYLFEDSLKNNLKFGLDKNIRITNEKIEEVLRDVGLHERFGQNIEEKIFAGTGDFGKTSGGETSRIGLARVLLKIRNSNCRMVFLDEPTASVDKKTKKEIAQIINKEKENKPGTTFVVISHDTEFVSMLNCNIEIKMEKGKIAE